MSKSEFVGAGVLVLFSVIAVLCLGLVLATIDQPGEFEYTTYSGDTGAANFCTVSCGQSRCRTDDGTTIMVERYKKK